MSVLFNLAVKKKLTTAIKKLWRVNCKPEKRNRNNLEKTFYSKDWRTYLWRNKDNSFVDMHMETASVVLKREKEITWSSEVVFACDY